MKTCLQAQSAGILALSEKTVVVYLSFCTVSFSAGWFNQMLIRRTNRSEKKRQTAWETRKTEIYSRQRTKGFWDYFWADFLLGIDLFFYEICVGVEQVV